jgi:transposase-like protein
MDVAATKRIDAGIKRGPRIKPATLPKIKLKPSQVENEQRQEARAMLRNAQGQMISRYTPEFKQQVIADVLANLEYGITVEDVAKERNLPPATLHSWLIADNRASEARTQYYSMQVAKALERLETGDSPLELARGRELHRAWITTAAVRDNANFGQKQELTIKDNTDLGERLRRSRERTIDGEVVKPAAPAQPSNIIDLQPDATQQSENTPK